MLQIKSIWTSRLSSGNGICQRGWQEGEGDSGPSGSKLRPPASGGDPDQYLASVFLASVSAK